MAIKFELTSSYWVICDECECWGPRRFSEEDAHWAAMRDGFTQVPISGDPDAEMKDLCFVCGGEWGQDNIKLNTAGAQAGREDDGHRSGSQDIL